MVLPASELAALERAGTLHERLVPEDADLPVEP
jgi:hypothetical protein